MSGIGRSQGLLGTDDVGDFNFPDDVCRGLISSDRSIGGQS